tara:strand:- start:349 stop:1470 length:1122 start_codon:yes stop_codon:yes gene_type:complete
MSISFSSLNRCLPLVTSARLPVLLRGRHGIGKSQVIYQFAENIELPVVERRASQMTEGDLLGIPSQESYEVNGRMASKFRPFSWLVRACTEPVVLFFDEIDRAVLEVRQGIFELTDSRKLAGWELHPDTVIFAAINGGAQESSSYQVGEMDPAELDRWSVFDVDPSHEDWKAWAKGNVNEDIINFLDREPKFLEFVEEHSPGTVYPSRRSWDRLSETASGLIDQYMRTKDEATLEPIYNIACSFVGMQASVSFADYLKNCERKVSVEDVFIEGRLELVDDFTLSEHCDLIEKLDEDGSALFMSKDELDKSIMANVSDYFVKIPSEAAAKLWSIIGSGELKNIVAFHKSKASDGTIIREYIVDILSFVEDQRDD